MIKIKLTLLLLAAAFSGCVPDMSPSKTVLKSITTGSSTIEWYSMSSAYAEVPDRVTIADGEKTDTICTSTNIASLDIRGKDTIVIGFYGKPRHYSDFIKPAEHSSGFVIVTDTSRVFKPRLNSGSQNDSLPE